MASSYDTSNRVLHALSAVSDCLLRVSLTELSYSSQVHQRLLIDLAVCSETHLRMCVYRVLSDGNWLPLYVVDVLCWLMKDSVPSIVTHTLFTLCEIWTVTVPMSTAVAGPSIIVVSQCRWWLLPFCRDLNDSPLRSNQWRTAWMHSVNAGRVLLSLNATHSCVSSVYFRFGRPCLLFLVVDRCCNHLRTLSLNSWRSKTPTLTLEFWRYLSQLQGYKYFRFGRPYCYFQFLVADAITRGTFFELVMVKKFIVVVEISTLSIIVPEI